MKARIVKEGTFYIGQVYGTWNNILFGTTSTGWRSVTGKCCTKWGVQFELEKWKEKNCPDTFEL